MNTILQPKPDLSQAAAVLIEVNRRGAELDLDDFVQSAAREFKDVHRTWRLNNPIAAVNLLAHELARLTCAPFDDCKAAVMRHTGDDEIQVRIDAIADFAKQIQPARRRA